MEKHAKMKEAVDTLKKNKEQLSYYKKLKSYELSELRSATASPNVRHKLSFIKNN